MSKQETEGLCEITFTRNNNSVWTLQIRYRATDQRQAGRFIIEMNSTAFSDLMASRFVTARMTTPLLGSDYRRERKTP